jgi:hypothetical protein
MRVTENKFSRYLGLALGLPEEHYYDLSMDFFDRDGFELNELEQALYRRNNVNIGEQHLNHTANHVTWIESDANDDPRIMIDHSCLQQRHDYIGEGREDLQIASNHRRELKKLLAIVPKWGIDFNVDYVGETVMELFHIEVDRRSYEDIMDQKYLAERLILRTDWVNVANIFYKRRDQWEHLPADDQIEWKVRYLGWPRVYDTRKVFI